MLGQAGYGPGRVTSGAGFFQFLDRGEGENRFDKEPAIAGWRLSDSTGHYPRGPKVTRDDMLHIISAHPHWEHLTRMRMVMQSREAPVFPDINRALVDFESMSYMDQAAFLRRFFR